MILHSLLWHYWHNSQFRYICAVGSSTRNMPHTCELVVASFPYSDKMNSKTAFNLPPLTCKLEDSKNSPEWITSATWAYAYMMCLPSINGAKIVKFMKVCKGWGLLTIGNDAHSDVVLFSIEHPIKTHLNCQCQKWRNEFDTDCDTNSST